MFFKCAVSQQIWYELAFSFSFPHLSFISINAAFAWWGRQEASKRSVLPITLWCVWKWRNLKFFEDSNISFNSVLFKFYSFYQSI